MTKKWIKRIVISIIVLPVLLFTIAVSLLYAKQDAIVQELLTKINADFKAEIKVGDSHISPFAAFPYVSIDVDNLVVFPDKSGRQKPLVELKDIYVGFDLLKLISGKIEIATIKLKDGFIHVIQDADGNFNIVEAFATDKPVENAEEEFHLHLKSVTLENIDITKLNERNHITIETFINKAQTKFKTSDEHMMVDLNTKLVLNVIKGTDTTFFKHKHIRIDTKLDLFKKENNVVLDPSELEIEHALFNFEGSLDLDGDMLADLRFKGNKPNFDLFLAFAPEELAPVLSQYDNKGKIFFDAAIKGKLLNGNIPFINVDFGCEHAMLHNKQTDKKLDELNFKAHFTNNGGKGLESMQFSLMDFSSRPEAGTFSGYLKLKNFVAPEIDTRLVSDFDLDFLAKFLNVEGLKDLKGKIKLTLNFRDIIDLSQPERAIEKLNESYFTELIVTNLSFGSKAFHVPVSNVNIHATLEGHEAFIKRFEAKLGRSDISVKGHISDLPAIIHHTKDNVESDLSIKSRFLDLKELTSNDTSKSKPFDEQIENFAMRLRFKSSAKAFTESPNLPVGEFFIDDMYAKFKHYPHTLHDFHADIFIDTSNFRVIDFTGLIDKSDFHFNGKLHHYDLWFQEHPKGDTKMEFDLTCKLLKLHDVFSYKGANYVPEDYRHEELSDFKLHGHVDMHFNEGLKSTDLYLDNFSSRMKLHKYKFERFKGRVHYENDHLLVQDFFAKIGKSEFEIDLNYFLGKDKAIKKRDNHFGIKASYLDMDELFAFNPPPATKTTTPEDHEKGFNIYEVPFTDMTFDLNISHLIYHRYLLHDFVGKLRTTENHYIYIDTLHMLAADGRIDMNGYFNGSDKSRIYFSPVMKMQKIDMDKLMLKFENFGQDHLVSENIHGKLSGKITGKVHVHSDMVPIIDDSEIHMDIEVTEGKLEKYAPLTAMADYFKDKNVAKVLFDTLKHHIDKTNGVLSFPMIPINTTLSFIEVSGKQDMNFNMEYIIKVPMKLVTDVAKQKLFGGKENNEPIDPEKEDEIQYKEQGKKIRYVNLKLSGNSENFKITLVKDKEIQK